ncbi:MAG TPA: AcvB/VirJ family lysyl-phosphatidylglycerol hydrolase [Steroidobacteraceae bacterium]|jgi:type IV secretory pathway VirJ component
MMRLAAVLGVLVIIAFLVIGDAAGAETITHGRFREAPVFRPRGEVKHFAMLLSGDGGWNSGLTAIANLLAAKGTLVIGIDTERLYQNLEKDGGSCVFPDGDLENLSHFVQAYYHLPTYFQPILIGHSAGASMVYAMLAQAPAGTFAGGLSLSFCVDLDLEKPLCKTGGLSYKPQRNGIGVTLLPAPKLSAPWIAMHGNADDVCSSVEAEEFVSHVNGAKYIELPGVDHNYRAGRKWTTKFDAAFDSLAESADKSLPRAPESLAGLPIIEVPVGEGATGNSDTFAVLLSGDGGWAGLDKEVAGALAEKGIPVAGVDSLRYFWTPRTPVGIAQDMDRLVRYYSKQWHRNRAILIGYSQGADVLPFAVNRLQPLTREQVKLIALIGISKDAAFEFHVTNWLGGGTNGLPTAPEMRKLSGSNTLCIYGDDDEDSVCPSVAAANAKVIKLSGGHHFGGDYAGLAKLIAQP